MKTSFGFNAVNLGVFGILSTIGGSLGFAQVNVSTLNETLLTESAQWVAAENWLTQAASEDIQNMFNQPFTENITEDMAASDATQNHDFELRHIDWRDFEGKNYVSPILNQGFCGSCVAFAAVGVLETQMNILSGIPQLNNSYSTEALFACGGGSCSRGSFPNSIINYLIRSGVPDEACAPQKMGFSGEIEGCDQVCSDAALRSQKIYGAKTYQGKGAIKGALQSGPLFVTMNVYEDFLAYSSGVYKHVSGPMVGGHAVSIIGFDEDQQAWIIRNSWGQGWGQKGFAYISYNDTSGIGQSGRIFKISNKPGYIVTALEDRSFLNKRLSFPISATGSATGNLKAVIWNEWNAQVDNFSCHSTESCEISIAPENLADGKYFFMASAKSGETMLHSQPKYFFITRKEIRPVLRIDISQSESPVHGDVKVTLHAKSGNEIPFERIAFRVKNEQDVVVRETWLKPNIETVRMNWRTRLLPNGKYAATLIGVYPQLSGSSAFESQALQLTIQN